PLVPIKLLAALKSFPPVVIVTLLPKLPAPEPTTNEVIPVTTPPLPTLNQFPVEAPPPMVRPLPELPRSHVELATPPATVTLLLLASPPMTPAVALLARKNSWPPLVITMRLALAPLVPTSNTLRLVTSAVPVLCASIVSVLLTA